MGGHTKEAQGRSSLHIFICILIIFLVLRIVQVRQKNQEKLSETVCLFRINVSLMDNNLVSLASVLECYRY